jgi:Adenylate and Guanylate cyclase catalytic domain
MGIHMGPVIVGDIGTSNRINYTIVGDAVNATQRLESLGKTIDPGAEAIALVSEEIFAAASEQSARLHKTGWLPWLSRRRFLLTRGGGSDFRWCNGAVAADSRPQRRLFINSLGKAESVSAPATEI